MNGLQPGMALMALCVGRVKCNNAGDEEESTGGAQISNDSDKCHDNDFHRTSRPQQI